LIDTTASAITACSRCHRRVNSRQIGRLKYRHLDTQAARRRLPAHQLTLFARLLSHADELRMACGNRREVEALGFDDIPSGIAASVALAVRTVPHGDQYERAHESL
jgi:hypothetical protein